LVKIRVFGGRIKESIFGWRWIDLRIVMKCSERYIGAYIFFIVQWIGFNFEGVGCIGIYLMNI
jgi:uncharacterized membrane protein